MAEGARPIIIIKRGGGHGGHHGGAWKVAYADFVTAMMALFIVLWLLNTSKQIQEAVGGYFKDPTGTSKMVGNGQKGAADNIAVSKDDMNKIKDAMQQAMRKAAVFDKFKDQIEMTVTSEGLRIELLETAAGAFFESGDANPTSGGRELLMKLSEELGKLPNQVSIEGHTDAKPFARGGAYGNWELSTERGNAARRLMQQSGLGPKQVTQVRGFADQRLRKPAAPEDPSNRRISVIVLYQTPEAAGPAPAAGTGTVGGAGQAAGTAPAAGPPKPEAAPAKASAHK